MLLRKNKEAVNNEDMKGFAPNNLENKEAPNRVRKASYTNKAIMGSLWLPELFRSGRCVLDLKVSDEPIQEQQVALYLSSLGD